MPRWLERQRSFRIGKETYEQVRLRYPDQREVPERMYQKFLLRARARSAWMVCPTGLWLKAMGATAKPAGPHGEDRHGHRQAVRACGGPPISCRKSP
jgi:hypothetical protein